MILNCNDPLVNSYDVKNAILGVNGVNKIKVFKFYREGLNIKIFAQILTELGDIELSEVVSQ